VLFNRFYQPDIDLDTMTVAPQLSLSTSDELRLTLRWMALLHGRIDAYLAATTGIHSGADVLKVVLAGASVAMLASALIRNGPGHVAVIQREIVDWMEAHGHSSIRELRGLLSQRTVSNPSDYERANYTWTLTSYTRGLS
jgi:dihydroorotate dehydrogenase (fumarate)